jgi:membrane-associated protease RseP (regulator of RpoE activity)
MSDSPTKIPQAGNIQQVDLDRITQMVTSEFQIEESLIDQGIPTYYLTWPQETKQAFLRLLKKLEEINMIAFLRRVDSRVVLTVGDKPAVKPSNPRIYWLLFFATVATTFVSGYTSFPETGLNPFLSGAIFSASIMTVLGLHEMGHKITANRKKVEATSPYFIPGIPPLGTLGAVIMQKSLPRNRDALFDIGSNGPIAGFFVALIFSAVGITLLIPASAASEAGGLPIPLSWVYLLMPALNSLHLVPYSASGSYLFHPVAWAGWAGMVVTMLNLLPAGMLDGGHVAKSIVPDKWRYVLTLVSVATLLLAGNMFWFFALIVIFFSVFKHPGPLDDVSALSRNRKLAIVGLVAIFVLSFPI